MHRSDIDCGAALSMYSSDKIQQTQQHLAERGVRYCIGAFVDIHGVPKAKVVPLVSPVEVLALS